MDPSRSNRILREWSAVASAARRPAVAPRGVAVRSGIPTLSFAGVAVVALALVVAVAWLGTRGPNGTVGQTPLPSVPVASPVGTAAGAPAPTIGACDPSSLVARITQWEGAAGSRIADVELRNAGVECTLEAMERP